MRRRVYWIDGRRLDELVLIGKTRDIGLGSEFELLANAEFISLDGPSTRVELDGNLFQFQSTS